MGVVASCLVAKQAHEYLNFPNCTSITSRLDSTYPSYIVASRGTILFYQNPCICSHYGRDTSTGSDMNSVPAEGKSFRNGEWFSARFPDSLPSRFEFDSSYSVSQAPPTKQSEGRPWTCLHRFDIYTVSSGQANRIPSTISVAETPYSQIFNMKYIRLDVNFSTGT